MTRTTKSAALAAAIALFCTSGVLTSARAQDGSWAQTHPRRDEVNDRLQNQNRRINREVREGELTRAQAGRLHQEDHAIRREERTMARFNHGHITRSEQRLLNQQENATSRQIGR